jgi:protein required for attachment to host cells
METLVVAANVKIARLLLRRDSAQPLEEVSSGAPDAAIGGGASTPVDEDASVHAFLRAAAQSADRAAEAYHVQRLVICAPPYALCALRDGLGRAGRRLLTREFAQDIAQQPLAEIDAWLRRNGV